MKASKFGSFVSLLAGLLMAAALTASAAPKKILFFTKSSGFEHSVISWKTGRPSFAEKVLLELGQKNDWEFTFSKDGSKFSPEYLAQFDAVFFYTTGDLCTPGTDRQPPMTPAGKQALFDYVRGGKGFIGTHAATDTFHTDNESKKGPDRYVNHGTNADPYACFIGGEFIIHGAQQVATNRVIDPKFPGFETAGDSFAFNEEWYSLKDFALNDHALTVIDAPHMTGPMYERPPYPNTWARQEGNGRVWYTAMGHREDVWTNPTFQQILVGGIKWALGEVSADVTPNLQTAAPGAYTNPRYLEINAVVALTKKQAAAAAGKSKSAAANDNSGGWVNLFNGKNLDGWEEHSGTAKYSVVDGILVGESVSQSGNSFLCTTQTYENFELEAEYKCDPLLNSGIQIRAECFPDARTLNLGGKQIKLAADRVHGYQCEIDMDAQRGRMWTAGIYDEARRGWLFPADGEKGRQGQAFSAQGRAISKNGDWNKLRIVADGASIKTWLNGEPRAAITDRLTPRGIIALQVHGIGKDPNKIGLKVSFRSVRIREIKPENNTLSDREKADGWKLLWDGQTADGWRSAKSENFPAHGWTMNDGVLTVHENGGEESAGGGDIITRQRYANFELTADFKLTPGANSGIKIFVQPNLSPIDKKTGEQAAVGSAIGCEFQILDDAKHPDAKLGKDGDRTIGSLYDLIPAPKDKVVMPVGEWNHARIVSQGRHVEFWLNGQKTVEFERGSPEFRAAVAASKYHNIPDFGEWADGHVLLQEHGNEVSFRNLKIRELEAK